MSSNSRLSAPVRLLLRTLLTIALVWAMAAWMDQYVLITGGIGAYVVIGALITLLNVLVRPLLAIVTLPLKLFATLIAMILVNAAFIWLLVWIADKMDPTIVRFVILGEYGGWIIVAIVVGGANWLMKMMLK